MATVLSRLHLSTIAGKRQLLHALRRSPAHQPAVLGGKNTITQLFSSPLLLVGGARRLKYNAAAGVSVDDNIAAKHHVMGALDDELGTEEHHSGVGISPPSSSSREYHSVAQMEAADDGDGDGGSGENMAARPARGVNKASLLGWGEPLPGGGPHYN
uniref:Uncharacterized protein n=1 Tax=Leersia perrieri TaxID=77586 RepID=A0A0D9X4V3_9ORYZ